VSARETTIAEFALEQISPRLGWLTFQVASVARNPDAEAVHDLRVAVRRFDQSLKVFSSLLPAAETKRIRKRLRRVMDAAGRTRDCDIALEFLAQAGIPKKDGLAEGIVKERGLASRRLVLDARRLHRANFSAKWRAALRLNGK
jgi:CHAD domain-containing protein